MIDDHGQSEHMQTQLKVTQYNLTQTTTPPVQSTQ